MTDDAFRALVDRAHRVVTDPDRDALRDVKRERRAALGGYIAAMNTVSRGHEAAIKAYMSTFTAEAAAHRAEARELRELLVALVCTVHGGARWS
ncbi:hypothetical protein BOH66_11380 [Microbacterium aurum]|uniref:Uncharacterized protein n=1 Tax=Microbacterium aurum TaxID=36805 RepID=A0A1P8U9I3_9MICO|nr:hypothetical protein [Microbacterium aurum]APZ34778.1 hypothetical protein BOH66_11380 [Microbacterium aurum]MBM7828686.1 hypothetical protein [Microbacterium aurum]